MTGGSERDPGRSIADQVRRLVRDVTEAAVAAAGDRATDDAQEQDSGTSIAAAVNIGGDHHTAAAYVDDEVVIVQRDGRRFVRRVRNREADRSEPSEPES